MRWNTARRWHAASGLPSANGAAASGRRPAGGHWPAVGTSTRPYRIGTAGPPACATAVAEPS